ncbi:hypothetical protein HOY82DRAFT_164843 [Tuber indicum]|nr:hypothetical protein HOY82DRAFT_164843 [Tuber indicum]
MNGVQSRAADKDSRTATDNDTHLHWLIHERTQMVKSKFVGMESVEVLAMWSGSVVQAFGKSGRPRRRVMDACFRPLGIALPTLVVMSGWSDTSEDMFRDMRDYMNRGNGTVRTVIVLKWHIEGSEAVVSCNLKVYEYARNRPDKKAYIKTQEEV